MASTAITPYRVDVSQHALDDLAARLRNAVRPSVLPNTGDRYGVPDEQVSALAAYWLDTFDWRAFEARINAYPQFTTEIDGDTIHFLHVESPRPDARPLILTHGWPGSVVEFLDVIEPLTNPADPGDPAFHLVIPSLPGIGFAGPTRTPGWGVDRTARAWVELMHRLGYDQYLAGGNDGGSMISPQMSRLDDGIQGVHVTQLYSFPSGDPAEFEDMTPADFGALARLQWFQDNKSAFNVLSSQQPQTLAYALADSPIGLLAWNAQLFGADEDPEFVIANIATYWFTGTGATAIRFYYEAAHVDQPATEPTTVPIGLAMFGADFQSVRRFADRDHANIVSWNAYDLVAPDPDSRDAGDHYAAHQHTDVWLADLRQFAAKL